jgi:4-hydroxy-4-methyl-2-oxoglutarate aldolase
MTVSSAIPAALRKELIEIGAATLHEAQGQRGAMDHRMKPLGREMRLAGPALTVAAEPGDNLIVHYAVTKASAGDILVIDAKGYMEGGLWGDVLSEAAIKAGIAGVVINGTARDCDTICNLGLPVFALGLSIKGTAKRQAGTVGQDIVCAGAVVRSGDIVVGDSDGVCVIRREEMEQVRTAAHARLSYEEKLRVSLKEGRTTVDLLNLAGALAALGLT